MTFVTNSLAFMSAFSRTSSALLTKQYPYSTTTRKTKALVYEKVSVSGCAYTGGISSFKNVFIPKENLIISDESRCGARYRLIKVEDFDHSKIYVEGQKSHRACEGLEETTITLKKETEISIDLVSRLNQLANQVKELEFLEKKIQYDLKNVRKAIDQECDAFWENNYTARD